jgi:hypothetical protein
MVNQEVVEKCKPTSFKSVANLNIPPIVSDKFKEEPIYENVENYNYLFEPSPMINSPNSPNFLNNAPLNETFTIACHNQSSSTLLERSDSTLRPVSAMTSISTIIQEQTTQEEVVISPDVKSPDETPFKFKNGGPKDTPFRPSGSKNKFKKMKSLTDLKNKIADHFLRSDKDDDYSSNV